MKKIINWLLKKNERENQNEDSFANSDNVSTRLSMTLN